MSKVNWQDIETAPKNGTWILLARYVNSDNRIPIVEVCRWYPEGEKWANTGWVNSKGEPFAGHGRAEYWSYI